VFLGVLAPTLFCQKTSLPPPRMVCLWLAALIAGVCATNSSVRDGAARLSDHTEQSSAWSPRTTSANASVSIVKGPWSWAGVDDELGASWRRWGRRTAAAQTAVARTGWLKAGLDKLSILALSIVTFSLSINKIELRRGVREKLEAGRRVNATAAPADAKGGDDSETYAAPRGQDAWSIPRWLWLLFTELIDVLIATMHSIRRTVPAKS
jgi:hypothetical protein